MTADTPVCGVWRQQILELERFVLECLNRHTYVTCFIMSCVLSCVGLGVWVHMHNICETVTRCLEFNFTLIFDNVVAPKINVTYGIVDWSDQTVIKEFKLMEPEFR